MTLAAIGIHHSNGKQGIPNFGLNEACITIGIKYYVEPSYGKSVPSETPAKPVVSDRLTVSPYLATGFHSCERIWKAMDRQGYAPLYQRLMTGADIAYRYHPLFGSGLGLDVVYTPNIEDLKVCDSKLHPEQYDDLVYCPVYFGVSFLQQFYYKNIEVHTKIGYYLYKKVGIIEDWGNSYQKVGFRYLFSNNLYLGFDLLAVRYDSSDCLEFSIGYNIPVRKR